MTGNLSSLERDMQFCLSLNENKNTKRGAGTNGMELSDKDWLMEN